MNKNELRNGMSFKMRNTYKFLILNSEIYLEIIDGYEYSNKLNHFISSYNNDMTNLDDDKYDIIEVYDIDGKLIWERDKVDWSKVKFGTKVIAWNNLHEDSKVEGLFLSLSPTAREPRFLVYYETNDCYGNPIGHANIFDKCKLIEEPKGEVTLDELILEHEELHKSCDRNCMSCKYDNWDANCMLLWILDNYEIIRK